MSHFNTILQSFPNIEPPYVQLHKQIPTSANLFLAIPEGKKCFAWFTSHNDQNVCVIMEINVGNKNFNKTYFIQTCFCDELAYGTVLYGTTFRYDNNTFFAIENVLWYKGKQQYNVLANHLLLADIFKYDLKQVAYNSKMVVFGLPIMSQSLNPLMNTIKVLPYKIDFIQYTVNNKSYKIKYSEDLLNNVNTTYYHKTDYSKHHTQSDYKPHTQSDYKPHTQSDYKQKQSEYSKPQFKQPEYKLQELVFRVTPDIQADIYNLYMYNPVTKTADVFYDVAYIPTYKSSVMMNKLFRNIKENRNLDLLEESDDEEEFENDAIDKFVYLNKAYNMVCTYNTRFKKWVPARVAERGVRITMRGQR